MYAIYICYIYVTPVYIKTRAYDTPVCCEQGLSATHEHYRPPPTDAYIQVSVSIHTRNTFVCVCVGVWVWVWVCGWAMRYRKVIKVPARTPLPGRCPLISIKSYPLFPCTRSIIIGDHHP